MAVTNDLATPQATLQVLATAYGLHLVQGGLVLHQVELSGDDKLVTVLQALANGPWDGPQEITYHGHIIDPVSFHFHPGSLSTGTDDTLQGVDSFFPGGITYNGTAYTAARLPRGIGDEDNPNELQGIYRCQKIADFDALGRQVDDLGALIPVPGAAAVAINATAGNVSGPVTYRVTFVGARGESEGGTISASVNPTAQQVSLTNIPLGPAGTTKRRIYRTPRFGGEGTHKLVATLGDNTTTTYNDNKTDAQLSTACPVVHEGYLYYSANPARVIADLILIQGGLPKSRIHWASWKAWRDYCATQIAWVGGFAASEPDSIKWRAGGNFTAGASGSLTKSGGAALDWDAGTCTDNKIPVGTDGGLHWVAGSGRYMLGLSRGQTLTYQTYNGILVALYMEQGSALWVYSNGQPLGNVGTWAVGDNFDVKVVGGAFKLYKNGVLINHASFGITLPAVPAAPLYGAAAATAINSTVTSSTFAPLSGGGAGETRWVPRFESHIAFTEPTDLDTAMDQVCLQSCSDWQEDGTKIRFLTPEPCAPEGQAPAHAAQRQIVHHFNAEASPDNIVKRTITAYYVPARELFNRMLATFRNLDDKDLKEDFVEEERQELQDLYGRRDAGAFSLGSMTLHQAKRVLSWLARQRIDHALFCELDGEGDSMHVLPGDIVKVTHSTYQWVGKLFMVIDAVDVDDSADTRSFVLQEYDPADYYKDTDYLPHPRIAPPVAPNPFVVPPNVASVVLSENTVIQADGTAVSILRGAVKFTNFTEAQTGRVWLKRPGESDYSPTNYVFPPHPQTLEAAFEIPGVSKGVHSVKVVTETRYAQASVSSALAYTRNITGKTTPPTTPAALNVDFDSTTGTNAWIQLYWDEIPDQDRDGYLLYEVVGAVETLIWSGKATTFRRHPRPGETTISFRLYSRDTSGNRSAGYAANSGTVVPLAAPATLTPTFEPNRFTYKCSPVPKAVAYLWSRTADFSSFFTSTGPQYVDTSTAEIARTGTIYVRAVDKWNNPGAIKPQAYNIPYLAAPSTLAIRYEPMRLVYRCAAVADARRYEWSRSGTFTDSDITTGPTFTETDLTIPRSGTIYVRAIDKWDDPGAVKSTPYNIPPLAAPAAHNINFDGQRLTHTCTPVANAKKYQWADDAAFTVNLVTTTAPIYVEDAKQLLGQPRSATNYVRALDAWDDPGAAKAGTYNVPQPPKPRITVHSRGVSSTVYDIFSSEAATKTKTYQQTVLEQAADVGFTIRYTKKVKTGYVTQIEMPNIPGLKKFRLRGKFVDAFGDGLVGATYV